MMNCPLCNGNMVECGDYLTCQKDTNHEIHITKELARFTCGEKDIKWILFRMKVRLGKKLHRR